MNRLYIIIGVTAVVLLFSSCGQKHKAEVVVEAFIEQYAKNPAEIQHRDFEHFDSTKVISDSVVIALQQRGNELFKNPIPYPVNTAGRMLYHIRMNYVYQGDTLWQTFYLDEGLEHVVAFK
jgi:hypothetical protein